MKSTAEKQRTILIIDDDASMRDLVERYLHTLGFAVLTAGEGKTGVMLFVEKSPDLVLLDLSMPEMDGFQVLEAVQKKIIDTPVIIISGVGTEKDTTKALKLGAWDYITKPFQELDILKHAVESALQKSALQAENKRLQAGRLTGERRKSYDLEKRSMELERAYNVLEREVHERKRAEKAIQSERAYMQAVIDGVRHPAMIVQLDRRVIMMNESGLAMLSSNYVGKDNLLCHQAYRQSDTPCSGEDHRCTLEELVETGNTAICKHRDILENGQERIFEVEASPLWNEDGTLHGFLEVIRNITEDLSMETQLREHQDRLYHLVHHDTLTSLPNRLLLQDRLQRMMVKAKRTKTNVAMLFLDLDRFKNVNDTLGTNS
jgi:DNA-binding response OmpR family regulator